MSTKDTDDAGKRSRPALSRLKWEREQRGWTQSELAERVGSTQVNISRWEKGLTLPSPYYRQKLGAIFGKSIQELELLPEHADALPLAPVPHTLSTSQSRSLWNVPYRRNAFFTGREEILLYLHTIFCSHKADIPAQPLAISGLGGIGKTQIAVEYAYRYCDHYEAVFWLTASNRDTLSADFAMLAALLALPEQHEQEQDRVVRAVKSWLSTHSRWLLILDNVDNLEMIVDFLPIHVAGDVLLTTQLQASGTLALRVEVEKMSQEEGIMFLLRRTKLITPGSSPDQTMQENLAQASEIVSALDGLPLALDQAGAYIEETRCGLSQYLALYSTRRKELLLRRGRFPVDHPDPVSTTWSLSFQRLEQESIAAADLLHLFAFLASDAIPEEIISLGGSELGPALAEEATDPLQVDMIIELLLRYSLIRRTPDMQSLSIHRLLQAVLKDGMSGDVQRLWAERSIRAMNRVFHSVGLQTWERCQFCLPHVQICATYIKEYTLAFPEAAHLFNEAASYLVAHANFQQAEPLLLTALAIRRQILHPHHLDTACTLNDLGELYLNSGRYQEAEQWLQEALLIRRQAPGKEHLAVAQTLYNLASLYRTQGAYSKAEPFYLEALHIRETLSDVDLPLVARSYYGLAKLYYSQQKYHLAEKYCMQSLQIREKLLKKNAPEIASTLNMLAQIYLAQKQLAQARKMNMRALHVREEISGKDHPHVAIMINNLVEIYHAEKKYREAEPLIARALKIHEDSLGPEHPYTAYSLSNKAENLFLQENYSQAELYYKKVLAIREKYLGLDHPRTASTYYALAKLYAVLERYKEAVAFCRKALSIQERTFGPDHPIVTSILEQHAYLLKKLKNAHKTD
jgi:tetratricopeptide (TPR) repeat protein/transcriptional regulator with XRE-family HTH domain